MKRIRIGNDISFRWAISRMGKPLVLDEMAVEVKLVDEYGGRWPIITHNEGNVIVGTFLGKKQRRTGKFSIVANLYNAGKNEYSVDVVNIFEIVDHSFKENGVCCISSGAEGIELSSNVTLPADGIGIKSIEQTVTSTESDGKNIITITLDDGKVIAFSVKNGSRGEDANIEGCNEAIDKALVAIKNAEDAAAAALSAAEISEEFRKHILETIAKSEEAVRNADTAAGAAGAAALRAQQVAIDVEKLIEDVSESIETVNRFAETAEQMGSDVEQLKTDVLNLQKATTEEAIMDIIKNNLGDLDDIGNGIKYVVKKTNEDEGTMDIFFLNTDKMDVIQEWMDEGYPKDADIVKTFYTAGIGGGGGGGVSDATLEARIKTQPQTTMVLGSANAVRFTYIVYYGKDKTDIETGKGKAYIYINGTMVPELTTELVSNETGEANEYVIDFGKYITSAESRVELRVFNADGTMRRTWTWKVSAYSLTVAFGESYLATQTEPKGSSWDLPLRVVGSNGILHVKVDDAELETKSVLAGSTTNVRIDASAALAEGGHAIEAWCVNEQFGLESEHIFTNFIKRGSVDAVVIGADAPRSAQQYGTISVPYYAYIPSGIVGSQVTVNVAVVSAGKIISTHEQKVTLKMGHLTDMLYANASLMSLDLGNEASMIITIDDIQAEHNFSIVQSEVELIEASECKVYYNFQGKSNADSDIDNLTSSYEGQLTSHLVRDWKLTDNNGCDGEGFRIPLGKRITIDLVKKFFSQDFGANGTKTGATFAIELKTSNVVNTDAVVVDCMGNDCGFRVYANRLEVKRAGSTDTIVAPFPENERLRVGIVIDGTATLCSADTGNGSVVEKTYNLAYLYIDGIVARLFEYGNDSWKQEETKDIVVGSDESEPTVYTIRVFDKALTVTEWLNTYAYDTPGVENKLEIATRNAILDSAGEVSMALIEQKLPNTAIHVWEMETIPPNKKTTVDILSSSFHNPEWNGEELAQASYEAGKHTCKADGTSSNNYPLPFKNLGETLESITIKYVAGDETSAVYSITRGTVGETEFVDKINFASSEGVLNLVAMNMYQKILLGCAGANPSLLTKQQLRQYEEGGVDAITYRQSLSGLPEIGFRKFTENGRKVTKYWSLFNLINNKYSGSIYGLKTKDGKDLADGKQAEMWEVDENVNFFNQPFTTNGVDENGALVPSSGVNDLDGYTTLYYCRVPKKSAVTKEGYGVAVNATQVAQSNEETKTLRRLHNWIVSVNPWLAEQYRAINGSYKMLTAPWEASDGTKFTLDNPAYRRRRFLEEYQEYLNSDSACFYFVFCTWILGMDSMDKNMTIVFDDVEQEQPKASFSLRDTDTWGQFNNTGRFTYPWWAEWGDTYKASTKEIGQIIGITADGKSVSSVEGATQIFNGAMSGLWKLVDDCLQDKIRTMYQSMRSAGLNDKAMMEMWDGFRKKWCDALYNYDAVKRYASTGNLDMAYGDKWALMRDFLTKRTRYMDAKYNNTQSANAVTMRFNSVPAGVCVENTQPTYASFNFGGTIVNSRNINGETAFLATPSTIQSFNNATCYLNDADLVNGFGGYTIDAQGNKVKAGIEALGQVAFTQSDLANLSKVREFVMAYTADSPNTYQQAEGFGAFEELKNFKRLRRLIITHVQGFKGVVECNSEDLEELDLTGTECSGVVINACKEGCTFALPSTAQNITINTASVDSYAVFSSIFNAGGSVQRISVAEPVNWRNASVDVILMLASAKSISISGTITITDAVNADAKLALMEAFGNIDSEDSAIRFIYNKVTYEPIMQVKGDDYIGKVGTYKYNLALVPKAYNGLTALSWSLSDNASPYATIDSKGNLNVFAMPAEDSQMILNREKITITATMTRHDGDLQSQTLEVGLFKRMEKVTINVTYAEGVTARADELYISLDGEPADAYPIEEGKVELLIPYNVDVVVTFKELDDATSPRTVSFRTGQDFRNLSAKYVVIVEGFAWMMNDGTEKPIGSVDAKDSRKIFGLIVTLTKQPYIIPQDFLRRDSLPSEKWSTAYRDFWCLDNYSTHGQAMLSKSGEELTRQVLEEYAEACIPARICNTITYELNGVERQCFFGNYPQMYSLFLNKDIFTTILQEIFGEDSLTLPDRIATINETSSYYFAAVILNQFSPTAKGNPIEFIPIYPYEP